MEQYSDLLCIFCCLKETDQYRWLYILFKGLHGRGKKEFWILKVEV